MHVYTIRPLNSAGYRLAGVNLSCTQKLIQITLRKALWVRKLFDIFSENWNLKIIIFPISMLKSVLSYHLKKFPLNSSLSLEFQGHYWISCWIKSHRKEGKNWNSDIFNFYGVKGKFWVESHPPGRSFFEW